MEPKTLRRALIAYTIVLVLSVSWAFYRASLVDIPDGNGFRQNLGLIPYLVMQLIFLKDLIYRRTLSPEQQYKWVMGFIIFNVIAFWRYYLKIAIPQPTAPKIAQ